MKTVIQRVKNAAVSVNGKTVGKIGKGICLFIGIKKGDTEQEALWLVNKITGLRIFEDTNEKMNLSIKEINGEILIISQFTLYGDCKKGKRPSFFEAAEPETAKKLYDFFIKKFEETGIHTETGIFRATMDVEIINDGPVTLIIESK